MQKAIELPFIETFIDMTKVYDKEHIFDSCDPGY